jgi:hypothetical protein
MENTPKKYNKNSCPQHDTWFANGGRCGWAHECKDCEEYRLIKKKEEKMQKIEYDWKIVGKGCINSKELIDALNKLGEEGWIPVCATLNERDYGDGYSGLFYRIIEQPMDLKALKEDGKTHKTNEKCTCYSTGMALDGYYYLIRSSCPVHKGTLSQ